MAEVTTQFDGIAPDFANYAETVRGHVRYELTHKNLAPFLGEAALQIADIGGGSGIDAVWLASRGHQVVIVEPSREQLAIAAQRTADLPEVVGGRISLVQGTVEDVLEDSEGRFDLVLSHGVAMYISDCKGFIQSLVRLAKPGGCVSLLEKGFDGQLERLIRQKKSSQEIEAFKKSQTVPMNNMGRVVRAFRPDELDDLLDSAGAEALDWSGVRINTDSDKRSIGEVSEVELRAIVDAEYEAGHSTESWHRGQMLHFIAKKLS